MKGDGTMEVAVKNIDRTDKKRNAMDTLFSYLDKGIDDLEADRVYAVDEAFQIIKDRMRNEV